MGVAFITAYKDEAGGEVAQQPLGAEKEHALRRGPSVMQAAAMGSVAGVPEATAGKAGVEAALGAVAVNDVGPEPCRQAGDVPGGCEVAEPNRAMATGWMPSGTASASPGGRRIDRTPRRHRGDLPWPRARSRTCRNRPPTGAQDMDDAQGGLPCPAATALADVDGRRDRRRWSPGRASCGARSAIAGDEHRSLVGARRVAAGDGDWGCPVRSCRSDRQSRGRG